jgi:hypothetical protein
MNARAQQNPEPKAAGAQSPPRPPRCAAHGLGPDGDDGGSRIVIKRATLSVLAQAQRDNATDLRMAPAADGGTAIRYKIEGAWRNWAPAGLSWPLVLSELGGLAGIRDAEFPKQGIIYVAYSGVRLRWQLEMTNHQDACLLHDLANEKV